ncbi:hypothetical protein GT037_004221 [Alternaria burnsii]|uniref:Uncharacterized protein n=1 Tax=Alternaria burnsii TaxID=1187904 RepID=A0A8H7EEZ1_9PLEO|nr:uncharacterized protein GT037_004221 [Alternaria burnsii]KAF7677362.1 hypothetical protein GT037_004221 [Alternaria burnsii]
MHRHSLDHCTYLLQRRLFVNETDPSFATKLLRKEPLPTLNHVVEKNEEGVFHSWYSPNVLRMRLTDDKEPKRQQAVAMTIQEQIELINTVLPNVCANDDPG